MDGYRTVTDDTLRETASHGSSSYPFAYYPENVWQFDFHRIDWHWHHELEFLFAAEGTVLCLVGADKFELQQGCGLFINSGILHRFEAQSSVFLPNIVFSPTLLAPEKSLMYEKYIAPVINAPAPYQIFHPHVPWQRQVLEHLSRIFALQEEEDSELCTVQLLLQIWELLCGHIERRFGAADFRGFDLKQARLQTMMQFIHDHYMEELTLEQIAGSASVSKSGALHIFQSGIQISPVAYLIRYRLAQAAEQLGTTLKSVSFIAEENGFTSAGYFCRKFRQYYNMSPNEYRRKKACEFKKQ